MAYKLNFFWLAQFLLHCYLALLALKFARFAFLLGSFSIILGSSCIIAQLLLCCCSFFLHCCSVLFSHTTTLVVLLLIGSSYFCLAPPSFGTFSSHVCYLFPFVLPLSFYCYYLATLVNTC